LTTGSIVRVLFVGAAAIVFVVCLVAIVVTGPVSVRSSRTETPVSASPERLRRDVERLCGPFSPRSSRDLDNLERASAWIADEFRGAGLATDFQTFEVDGRSYRNVVATRPGSAFPRRAIVIGAHYDAHGPHPGADDNASGVAVLLELARNLPPGPPEQTQFLVAFALEEPPYFGTDDMGSYRFARRLREDGFRIEAMVALDLVGRYSDEPGSQRFPLPGLGFFYPDRGNFIAVIGDIHSGSTIRRVRDAMDSARALPVLSFRGPASVPGVRWSDHLSFRRFGMPAVLVTDTAFLRHDDYHTAGDTPDKLDYERMAALVKALYAVLL
jgi:Zn-dependent M28 family amino/carboxypeptidase